MSTSLIDRSHDLKRLRDEGYEIEVTRSGHLLLKGVPYVTQERVVKRGVLVSDLDLEMGPEGEVTRKPRNHVARFIGEKPCDQDGSPLVSLIIDETRKDIGGGLTIDFEFSRKIKNGDGYRDYHHKMTAYVNYLSRYARIVEQCVTAQMRSSQE